MFHRILVPTDGSASSRNAAYAAIELAKATGGTLVTIHVIPPGSPEKPVESDSALMGVESQARMAGVEVTSEQMADHGAADAIMDCAQARQCDLIVMGAERYDAFMALVRDSTAQKVLAGSNVPVLVVH